MIKTKRTLKIIFGILVFFTLPSLLFFGFIYFNYNEELPAGIKGEQADALAHKMLKALDYEAYKSTNYIEWTFKNRHHYKWQKDEGICTVYWKDFKVILNLKDSKSSKVYIHNFKANKEQEAELIEKALQHFNNDSFWLVAPYKVFDIGTERRIVNLDSGNEALLVTYTSGGSTPGDSYLWILENSGKPKSFKMWTSIIPIDGLEATWSDWTTTKSGAQLPTFHKLLFIGLEMGEVNATK